MAVSETPRHKLKQYTAGTDPHPTRGTFNAEVGKLEELPAVKQGTTGNRPLSGVGKVLYWDESVKRFVYDDGTEWQEVSPIGGVIPASVSLANISNEGSSSRAARADHSHRIPFASAESHGAMRSEDKKRLDEATEANTPSTLVRRGAAGEINIGLTSNPSHAARKDYVDDLASPTTGPLRATKSYFSIPVLGDSSITSHEVTFPAGVMRNRPHFECHAFGTSPRLPEIEVWWTVSADRATVYIRSTTAFPSMFFSWLAIDV